MSTLWKKMHAILAAVLLLTQGSLAFAGAQPVSTGTAWKSGSPNVLGKTTAEFPQSNWWKSFQDPRLNQLIEEALENNPGLHAAKARIASAEAMSRTYRAPLLPTVSLDPSYTYNVYGQNQFIGFSILQRSYQTFQIPLDATYEVDLFGKNLARYQSSRKQIDVARYQYQTAQIELASLVATVYFSIAKWRRMEELARQQVEVGRRLLGHGKGLLELGQATLFDIQNEQQRLDQAEVNVTQFSVNRQVAENQLLALLGKSPSTGQVPAITPWEDLHWPAIVQIGIPSSLVVHRPDVAVAEAELAGADLDIKAARKAFLPSLVLTGSTGYNSVGLKDLFLGSSIASFIIGAISQLVFDGGRRRAELDLRKAYYEELLENYRTALINAFSDAENSLSVLRADQIVFQNVLRQTEAARDESKENLAKFKVGLLGEPPWLASEFEQIDYEKILTQQKVQVLIDVISVAKAMGGGFEK